MRHEPDSLIQEKLARIDPSLRAAWVDHAERWGIFHSHTTHDALVQQADVQGLVLQQEASRRGYSLPIEECRFRCYQALQDSLLVCYVSEENGDYRPLDDRIIEKLWRMDFYRRELGVQGWKEMLRAKADLLRERRQREQSNIWDCIATDRVFARVASDILWGVQPTRSVQVRRQPNEETAHGAIGEWMGTTDPGLPAGAEAAAGGAGGSALAAAVDDASPG